MQMRPHTPALHCLKLFDGSSLLLSPEPKPCLQPTRPLCPGRCPPLSSRCPQPLCPQHSGFLWLLFCWPHHAACGTLVPLLGTEPRPSTILATGPSGKSLFCFVFFFQTNCFSSLRAFAYCEAGLIEFMQSSKRHT